jgi:hypothetical protein
MMRPHHADELVQWANSSAERRSASDGRLAMRNPLPLIPAVAGMSGVGSCAHNTHFGGENLSAGTATNSKRSSVCASSLPSS